MMGSHCQYCRPISSTYWTGPSVKLTEQYIISRCECAEPFRDATESRHFAVCTQNIPKGQGHFQSLDLKMDLPFHSRLAYNRPLDATAFSAAGER